jgi:hypothetical protein
MNDVEPTALDAPRDRAVRQPERPKLLAGYDTVLARRKRRDRVVWRG